MSKYRITVETPSQPSASYYLDQWIKQIQDAGGHTVVKVELIP